MTNKLPKFLKKYFWDVDFTKLTLGKYKIYILKRILEYGDEKAVKWMWEHFKRPEMIDALSKYRGYSQKSANFWALILNVPKEDVLCLKKRSSKDLKTFWPY